MNKNIICLISGGMDSFVLLDLLKNSNFNLICLFIDYGQLSNGFEYSAFCKICDFEQIQIRKKIKIENFGNNIDSGLTQNEIKNDYFPSRNLILASIASSFMIKFNCYYLALGIINSSRIFSDCTPNFINQLELLISNSLNFQIKILTPLNEFTKVDIVKYMTKHNIPIELSYSCQKGFEKACNLCPSCIERNNAIEMVKQNKNKELND